MLHYIERFWAKVDRSSSISGCWLWTGNLDRRGYGRFSVSSARNAFAHRVSWGITTGEIPPSSIEVCHRCDNPKCVNPAHLFLGSHLDNMRDAANKNHLGHWKKKLTDAQLDEIRAIGQLEPAHVIASRYGVSRSTIVRIRTRAARRHEPNWKSNSKFAPLEVQQ